VVDQGGIERRRHRRIDLTVPILARRNSEGSSAEFKEGVAKDLSLAGMYFTTAGWNELRADEIMTLSVSVPSDKLRNFPFSRLAGRGRVVRVEELAKVADSGPTLYGVAIEFGQDLTVLTAAPSSNS
jgi:c-di-GMP-binding flagellar brake protein YcgR